MKIPFNKPFSTGNEIRNIDLAIKNNMLSGNGPFSQKCEKELEKITLSKKVLLTSSCTSALEMCALLIDTNKNDEIILPSFTFVSTANAFALRGAKIIFCDIEQKNLNINPFEIEKLITKKTKAVVVVHYAGISCQIKEIQKICKKNNIFLIEDAAHCLFSKHKNKELGTFGDLGTFSFHETKNIIAGEAGALVINNSNFISEAEIIREKGTDRRLFFQKKIDKYTWRSLGSSYLTNEITAAFLYAQIKNGSYITRERLKIWNTYYKLLKTLERKNFIGLPQIGKYDHHNAHMFYIILDSKYSRNKFLEFLLQFEIMCVSHYEPLHMSPAGIQLGITKRKMNVTETLSKQIVRLPLWIGLSYKQQVFIVSKINLFFDKTN